ncbi:MAG: polyprenyl synthetase family protein [Candidatus Cloacimonetes bacterium]|nr:polyprenyl synthetase family protein [Candidatus Cloacimonadota bacterium]
MLIQKYFETRLELIETALNEYLIFDGSQAKKLKEAIRFAVFNGGKRWRPLMMIAMYEMLSGIKKPKQLAGIIPAACAVEIIHCASTTHDDLPYIKNKQERRSKPAVHNKYDNTIAILAGDALYSLAFEVAAMGEDAAKSIEVAKILSTHCKSYGLIGGQAVDLLNKRKMMKINVLRFIDLKKSGSLIQACSDIACLFAEASDEIRMQMNTYVLNLAESYKMIEDIAADYSRGSDEIDNKDDFSPASKTSYTGLLGFDKARKNVDKLLSECEKIIAPFDNNDILKEFIQMIQERLP